MEEKIEALFADINARRVDDALKLYDDSYVFLAAFSELEFSKAELTDFFFWDQAMEASFAIQRIWSSPRRPKEVFVELVETSPFYAVLGVEGREVLMMFVFGEDDRVRESVVLRAEDRGREFGDAFADLLRWVAEEHPDILERVPIPPIGRAQESGRLPFAAKSARIWRELSEAWAAGLQEGGGDND